MKNNSRIHRGFTLVELLVVIVIIAALAGLAAPMVMSQRKKADLIQATSNAKNIGIAMLDFENNYGSFPDSTTAAQVTANTGSALNLTGTNANSFFKQLIASGIAQSEEMFYAKASYTLKPDNVFTQDADALKNGECGFGYIMNGTVGFSTAGNPARPIVCTPFTSALSGNAFDPDLYDFKAVVLNIDSSAKQLQIRATDNQAMLPGGNTLVATGPNTVWGATATPTVVYPTSK